MIAVISAPAHERLMFPAITALALVPLWFLPGWLSLNTQLIMLATLVVVMGLPHGALDPWLAARAGLIPNQGRAVLFNLLYLAIAALVVLVWLWLPATSLAIFLAISAWHFSGDWRADVALVPRVLAGSLLLLMPIGFHTDNVAMLFDHLSGAGGQTLAHALSLPAWLLVMAMMALTAWAGWQRRWFAALELFALLVLAYVAEPLVYFALYFCALHSLRHLAGLFRQAPAAEQGHLWRMTFVYTAATVLLAGALLALWSHLPIDTLILKLVFIGLAAVTVPHMMLMGMVWLRNIKRTHP